MNHTVYLVDAYNDAYHLKCKDCDYEVVIEKESLDKKIINMGDSEATHTFAFGWTMVQQTVDDPFEKWADGFDWEKGE